MTTVALPGRAAFCGFAGGPVLDLEPGRVGVGRFDLDVFGKRDGALDERAAGVEVCERTRARPLNSGTSVVKRRVTSITGASSCPTASTLNAIRMVSLFAASTACAIGWERSATMSYETLRRKTRLLRRSHFTTRLPTAWPPWPAPIVVLAIWLTQRNSLFNWAFGIS